MSLFERTKETAQKQGLTVAMVEKRAGLSENALYSWRKSSPKSENLQKVADVLHVSTDYLLGRTDEPNHYMTETERMTSNIDLKEAKNNGAILSWGGVDIDDDDMEIIKRILEGK